MLDSSNLCEIDQLVKTAALEAQVMLLLERIVGEKLPLAKEVCQALISRMHFVIEAVVLHVIDSEHKNIVCISIFAVLKTFSAGMTSFHCSASLNVVNAMHSATFFFRVSVDLHLHIK